MIDRTASNIRNHSAKCLGISLGLFAYYAGEFSIVFWLVSALILGVQVRRLPNWFLAYIVVLISFFGMRILLEPSAAEDILRDARFYWGFVIFLPFFISEQRRFGDYFTDYAALFRFLLNLCLILLFVEFLTANLLVVNWPNRSHELVLELESASLARAYGFGGNATVTSVLLIAFGTILYAGKFMRDFVTLGLATSGTGFMVLLLKSTLSLKTRHLLMAAALFMILYNTVWVGLLESELLNSYSAISKLSLDYVVFLIDFKYEQYQSVMAKTDGFQLLFGQSLSDPSLRTGDFQMLDFLTFNGFWGVGMLMLIIAKCINKTNRVTLLLLLAATAHYQVIFSLPGQILFAWVLTVGMSPPRKRFKSANSVAVHPMAEPLPIRG